MASVFFFSESFLNVERAKLLPRFEQYCFNKNINKFRNEIFAIDPNEKKDSILLECRMLEFIHYWKEFLTKGDIEIYFEGITDRQRNCLNDAKMLIDKNISSPIPIKKISKTLAINECDLKKNFRKAFGLPIRQYIIKERMERAKQKLTKTDKPILEICHELGYSRRSHFSALYKRYFGINPHEERKISHL